MRPLTCWQQDSLLLAGPGIYPQIYHRTLCPAVLIYKGSNNNQRSGRIISNGEKKMERHITNGETFHLSWQTNPLGSNLTRWPPSLHLPKKAFLSLSIWPRREHACTLNWNESLIICFENCPSVSYSYRQSKNRMMTLL